ncbi:MAG: HAMP domain-containing sensor histidine kinase [Clostridia bacterium]
MKSKRSIKDIKDLLNTNTLTFKLWIYFVSFAIVLFIILWFMQVIFLQSYYSSMKKSEIARLATDVENEYANGEYSDLLDNIAYKNASNIFIFDKTGKIKYSSSNLLSEQTGISQMPSRPILIETDGIVEKIIQSPNQKISYTINIDKFKSQLYVYGRAMQDSELYLVIVSSIDPIDATTNVLKSQLIYVTIIALFISSIISIFISRRLAQPISKINTTAQKLARGNYDIVFEKAGYREVDDLATTLNYATRQLAKTDKVRKELIANVSHDLRTPLTMIKAYTEMIRDLSGDNKEKREEHLNIIIDETDRLSRLVSDMMDLSKIESGFSELNKTNFNVVDVINSMVNSFKILKQNIECSFKVEALNDIWIFADKTKIEQVLYNLIGNAINHSENEKKIIVNVTQNSKRVKIQIIDNGPGISKEDLPHIWNRYYKTTKSFDRPKSGGTGLGLSIVKNILDKHEANYGVISEISKGATFWFDIERSNKKDVVKDIKEEKQKNKKPIL